MHRVCSGAGISLLHRACWAALALCLAATLAGPVLGAELLQAVRPPAAMTFCGEPVPLGQPEVVERFEKEMLLALGDPPQVLLWLKRAPCYLPAIEEQLRDRRMPDDLKFLAIAESALRPHAGSSKGAVGFWQLMPETARKYGLTVDEFVDERRSLAASTRAALAYLQALQQRFSSWTLAAAAYNMGEEGLSAESLEQNITDYYKLYLPLETQQFIFRVLAVKRIVSNPHTFGFKLQAEDYYKTPASAQVSIDCFQELPIRLVAEAADSYFKMIKDLNPQLRGHYLQTGRHQIMVPPAAVQGFQERLNRLADKHAKQREQRLYIVQKGDTLSDIAAKFEVPLAALVIWNRIDPKRTLQPGERLVIHPWRAEAPGFENEPPGETIERQ